MNYFEKFEAQAQKLENILEDKGLLYQFRTAGGGTCHRDRRGNSPGDFLRMAGAGKRAETAFAEDGIDQFINTHPAFHLDPFCHAQNNVLFRTEKGLELFQHFPHVLSGSRHQP